MSQAQSQKYETAVASAMSGFSTLATEKLLDLWRDHDPQIYTPAGFEAMRRVLTERLGGPPEEEDWDEPRDVNMIDITGVDPGALPAVPSWYKKRTMKGVLLQLAAIGCAILGFVCFLIYDVIWESSDVLHGLSILGWALITLLIIIQTVFALVARQLWVSSKQLRIPAATDEGSDSETQLILYLRPFNTDHNTGTPEIKVTPSGLEILRFAREPTFEEVMVMVLGKSRRVVAIGRPGEKNAPPGAQRQYIPESDSWTKRVAALLPKAQIVVLVISDSPNLLFEVDQVAQHRGSLGVLLVWEPYSLKHVSSGGEKIRWSRFRNTFEAAAKTRLPRHFDRESTMILAFSPNGRLHIIVGTNRSTREWHAAFVTAQSLMQDAALR